MVTSLVCNLWNRFLFPAEQPGGVLEHDEKQRDEERGNTGGGEHAADDPGADCVQTVGTGTGGDRHRYTAEDEGQRGHNDRS